MKRHVVIIFSANTDCGKTLLSSGLLRAAARSNRTCLYIKPVQTGNELDMDKIQARSLDPKLKVTTLFSFKNPVSPHLAAFQDHQTNTESIPSSFEIREQLKQTIETNSHCDFVVVETAGGVLSPFPDGTPCGDALERFAHTTQATAILVGDAKLGGISQTLCALESLERRRFDVSNLVLFPSLAEATLFQNASYFSHRFRANPVVSSIPFESSQPELKPEFFDHADFQHVFDTVILPERDRRVV